MKPVTSPKRQRGARRKPLAGASGWSEDAMKRLVVTLILATVAVAPLPAADPPKFDAAAAAKMLAPFIDEQTFAVARLDAAGIDLDAAAAKLARYTGQADEDLAQPRRMARDFQARFTRAGGRELYVVFSIADLPRHGPFVLAPAAAGADMDAIQKALGDLKLETTDVIGGVAFAGSNASRERLRTPTSAIRPELEAALAAT